uniref:Pescadillo homolog n=1 Tax=Parascaris univalens TaxID=6257 RepID=A0A915B5U3_PARUN
MRIKRKHESGAATNYITRTKALRKLQLSLKDFRRLCILKGIYPHEPLHKKKVNKGTTENRVYYYVKDINFLATEPIINKFRDYKIFLRRLTTAKAKREEDRVKRLYERRPEYQLDTIVKERYPTFASALRDLDDALCLCFAFALLPHTKIVRASLVATCRRLTAEFNNFIIESHSLTKVFISIKGIYYEAHVMGERLTWIVAHERGVGHVTEVDFSVMATFAEFYSAMLSFVNYRLYQSIGLFYPPQIAYSSSNQKVQSNVDDEDEQEKVYSLARPLAKRADMDNEPMPDIGIAEGEQSELAESIRDEGRRKKLFINCHFWINREAPKDMLAIIVRSCGGTVSWDNCAGSSYSEDDERITHQIIDRPLIGKVNINRVYIQPQWVVDSFNMRRRLPVEKYLPGVAMPPHLSPFTTDTPGQYVPEERIEQLKELGYDVEALLGEKQPEKKKKKMVEKKETSGMSVDIGKIHKENKQKKLNEEGHDLKMREMMIAKRYRRVYHKIKRGKKRQAREVTALKLKRAKLAAESAK